MSRVIEVVNLSRIYTSTATPVLALQDINFSVERGEFVCIMGPSGSGKSTLMHILGCLDKPTSGNYYLEGLDTSRLTDSDLATLRLSRIGFVFQSFNLLPRASVLRNVALPLVYSSITNRRERLKRAISCLEAVGLDKSLYEHRSNELSGGQIQRAAIARALINDPAIILADEPTGNLDSASGELVMQAFKRLSEVGKTIVLITHDPHVSTFAHRTCHIRDGRIV